MITPDDIRKLDQFKYDLNDIENLIDKSIILHHKDSSLYEYAQVYNEYPKMVRDAVCRRYKEAGWKFVYHCSSEDTTDCLEWSRFIFSMVDVSKIISVHYTEVTS